MEEQLEQFWAVKVAGTIHRVSTSESERIMSAIDDVHNSAHPPVLFEVEDIYGCPIHLDLLSISGIWLSTPELREAENKHQKQLETEWNQEF